MAIGHFDGTQFDYYYGNDYGNYQFVPLEEIIYNFQNIFVGEDKLIPKLRRVDIAYHAQRALAELSFDTFKSIKSQQIEVPPSLQMILPHDYVNYTRLTWVDDAGIEHPIYRTNGTSNPFQIRQHTDGTYDFPENFELVLNGSFANATTDVSATYGSASGGINGKDLPDDWITTPAIVGGAFAGGSDVTVDTGVLSFNHSSHNQYQPHGKVMACWQLLDVSDLEFINISANGVTTAENATNSAGVTGPVNLTLGQPITYPAQASSPVTGTFPLPAGTLRFGLSTSPGDTNTYPDTIPTNLYPGPFSQNQHPDIFDVPHQGGFAYKEWSAGDSGVKSIEGVNVTQYNQVYILITSFVPFDQHPVGTLLETLLVNNTIDDITVTNAYPVNALQTAQGNTGPNNSSTWDAFKSSTTTDESASYSYDDHNFDTLAGERYGLDPQHAQVNGSFYIDERMGKIHFSSNISGKDVILDYISDSLGTEKEMQVHKLAEDAMYKHMLHDVMMSLRGVGRGQLAMYKKDKFAAVRKAKLRLSNIKLEEITQVLRGKSKWIKH
jgi:hypothetical protein